MLPRPPRRGWWRRPGLANAVARIPALEVVGLVPPAAWACRSPRASRRGLGAGPRGSTSCSGCGRSPAPGRRPRGCRATRRRSTPPRATRSRSRSTSATNGTSASWRCGASAPACRLPSWRRARPRSRASCRGDARAAARHWAAMGEPYAQALALLGVGDPEPLLDGIALLDGLGATAAASFGRARLRRAGVTRMPRGPRPATRANPAGLTPRQLQVLELVAQGLLEPRDRGAAVPVAQDRRAPRRGDAGQARRALASRRRARRAPARDPPAS